MVFHLRLSGGFSLYPPPDFARIWKRLWPLVAKGLFKTALTGGDQCRPPFSGCRLLWHFRQSATPLLKQYARSGRSVIGMMWLRNLRWYHAPVPLAVLTKILVTTQNLVRPLPVSLLVVRRIDRHALPFPSCTLPRCSTARRRRPWRVRNECTRRRIRFVRASYLVLSGQFCTSTAVSPVNCSQRSMITSTYRGSYSSM